MFYHKIIIKGFGNCYNRKEINFSTGINVITGKNGSGKTTIIDAIQWNMFGPRGSDRTLSDRTSIINNRSQSAHVEFTFYNEMGEEIVSRRSLSRSGKHSLTVYIDGEEVPGGLTASQEVLDNCIFNIDNQAFTAVSMLQSSPSLSVNQFITGSSDTKREILSTIVDPTARWEKSYKACDKKLREERKNLKAAEEDYHLTVGLLDNLSEVHKPDVNIDDLRSELHDVLERKVALGDDNTDKVSLYTMRIKENNNKIIKIDNAISSLEDKIEEKEHLIDNYKHKMNSLKSEISRIDETSITNENDSIEYSTSAINKMIIALQSQEKNIKNIVARREALNDILQESKHRCLVCGTDTTGMDLEHNIHTESIDELVSIMNDHSNKIDYLLHKKVFIEKYQKDTLDDADPTMLQEQYDHYHMFVDDYKSSINESHAKIKALKEKRENLGKDIAQLQESLTEAQNATDNTNVIKDMDKKIESLEHAIRDAEFLYEKYNEYVNKKKKLEEKIAHRKEVFDNQTSVVNILVKLREDTSVKGIISEDIDTLAQEITTESNILYNDVFDNDNNIIVSSAENKKGTPITEITALGRDLGTFSHGEQGRMIMVILMALTKVMYDRYNVWITPMWDEPTAMIDLDDNDSMFNILNYYDHDQSIVITRDYDIIEKSQKEISNTITLGV